MADRWAHAGRSDAGRNDVIRGTTLTTRRTRPSRRVLIALSVTGIVLATAIVGLLLSGGSDTQAEVAPVRTDSDAVAAAPPSTTTTAPPTTTTTRPPRDLGRLVLVGDSVAMTLADALTTEATSRGLRFTATAIPGCGMITGLPAAGPGAAPVTWPAGCEPLLVNNETSLAARRNAGTVLWLSTWETSDRWVDGTLRPFGTPQTDELLLGLMEQARARLLAGSDALLVLVKSSPTATTSQNGFADPDGVRRMVHLNELFDRFASSHPVDTRVMDLAAIVCPTGPPCPAVVDGITLRPKDGGHFSTAGATWLAPRFLDELTAVAG